MHRVLITCAGHRTSLVEAFAQAVHARGGMIFAADFDGLAPALYFVDKTFKVPQARDPSYIDKLLELVAQNNISTIIPTIDPELLSLAENRERFLRLGCMPIISEPKFIRIASDKWFTMREFAHLGFNVPKSWLPENMNIEELPEIIFVKPRQGSASQHAYRIQKKESSSRFSFSRRADYSGIYKCSRSHY